MQTIRILLTKQSIRQPIMFLRSMALYSSNIRDSGGAFGKKEIAEEERWMYEHEKEALKKYKEQLEHESPKKKDEGVEKNAQNAEKRSDDETVYPRAVGVDSSYGGSVRSGGGALGKKEAAIEEKYFREHDQELIHKMHDKQKPKLK